MSGHFLKEINIIDYKCFKDFQLDGFERVNLISGKNNIGKTAFLEAGYIVENSHKIGALARALINAKDMRENINLLSEILKNRQIDLKKLYVEYLESMASASIKSNNNIAEFKLLTGEGKKEYFFRASDKETVVNVNEFSLVEYTKENIEFIDNFGWSDAQLIDAFEFIQRQDQESYLNDLINDFDSSIEGFKVIGDEPQCKVNGKYYDLIEFGDGLKHYISIICALHATANGQLFIDEIDNGIHYTQLENIWKIIFEVSKKVNCQVFATTHSKECIEAFSRVNEENEGAYFEFYRSQKNNAIEAFKRDAEALSYALEHERRIRGE